MEIYLEPGTSFRDFDFGTYDIETVPGTWDRLYYVGVYDGVTYKRFDTMFDFIRFATQRKYQNWRWFAHYGGRFDVNFVFDEWKRSWMNRLPRMSAILAGSFVIKLTLGENNRLWHFTDSFRLLPEKLSSLTEAFNVEHKKLDMNVENPEYNEHDCRGLYEVLTAFFSRFSGLKSETLASHAMQYFRSVYLKHPIRNLPAYIEDFVRRSYVGGRNEIFKFSSSNARLYDVNSLYPYCMTKPVPTHYYGKCHDLPDRSDRMAFLDCVVKIPDCYIPSLPLVLNGKLKFVTGNLSGIWAEPELKAAVNSGAVITKVREGHCFDAEPILRDYAVDLFERKKQSTRGSTEYIITKLLLNSLYGKFGQSRTKKVYELDYGRVGVTPIRNSPFCTREVECRSSFILPQISSAITSYARAHLFDLLCSSDPYYCDTDSIVTTKKLFGSNELGALRCQEEGSFQFVLPKVYAVNDIWKAKGIWCQRRIGETDQSFVIRRSILVHHFVKGEKVEMSRMTGLREAIRMNDVAVHWRTISKQMSATYDKRAFDGENDTRPWTISEMAS